MMLLNEYGKPLDDGSSDRPRVLVPAGIAQAQVDEMIAHNRQQIDLLTEHLVISAIEGERTSRESGQLGKNAPTAKDIETAIRAVGEMVKSQVGVTKPVLLATVTTFYGQSLFAFIKANVGEPATATPTETVVE